MCNPACCGQYFDYECPYKDYLAYSMYLPNIDFHTIIILHVCSIPHAWLIYKFAFLDRVQGSVQQ